MATQPDELCQRCGMAIAVQALISPKGRLVLQRHFEVRLLQDSEDLLP
jgi:hypothetical protein